MDAWSQETVHGSHSENRSTGFPDLDAILPWQGWPPQGMVELISRPNVGELRLLMPLLAHLSQQRAASLWVCPPQMPYAPALLQANIALEHVFVLQSDQSWRQILWAVEKALHTPECPLVLIWPGQLTLPLLRRLQLAAQTGNTLGVLFQRRRIPHSPSVLQLTLETACGQPPGTLEVKILKARGSHQRHRSVLIPCCR